ncbi:hypothetical protein E2C01_043947 [Portunus trituberculatus]|uniref:Uncharacterized protein n=1 Tax=Portunus trituberculatus TaxID=210409 RepID=A0A5B7FXR7_PORTR|nr:hypothetical protein [Portunus trituberculatus]
MGRRDPGRLPQAVSLPSGLSLQGVSRTPAGREDEPLQFSFRLFCLSLASSRPSCLTSVTSRPVKLSFSFFPLPVIVTFSGL